MTITQDLSETAATSAYLLGTGLAETRSNTADMTFVWSIDPLGNHFQVKCAFGGGNETDNTSQVMILVGHSAPVRMPNQGGAIYVNGSVNCFWFNQNRSVIVSFSGQMVRGNYSNVFSVGQGIIVGAFVV
ncbi:MAG TPA: hypothetical protein VGF48_14655 [Thermoanaerobaculia bacterium]|jgi:hypothetical protein